MKWKQAVICASWIFLASIMCGQKDQTYTIEIKDGVNYVHNHAPLWEDEPKVALELVQKIGDIDAEDENYFFNQLVDCTRDPDGNIYILDWRDENIKKYDAQGTYITTFGKRGQGPGEFIKPAGIDSDSESNIYVSDLGNNRIQIFTTDGKYKDSYRLSSYSSKNCVLSSGYLIVYSSSDLATGSTMLRKLDTEGNTLKKFGKPITYSDPIINESANSIFLENDNDDNIYITFEYENRIEKYNSDGELLWTIDRPLNFNIKHKRESRVVMEEEFVIPRMIYVSHGIGIDHKGRVWVVTYNRQPEKDHTILDLEIFDNDGILLGSFPAPVTFHKMRISGDRLLLIDEFQEVCLYEYKIVEK